MKRVPFVLTAGVAAAVALVAVAGLSSVKVQAASPQTPSAQTGQPSQPQPDMAEMMKRHQQMMSEMRAADAKLDELAAAMNTATGDAKVAAIARVVDELVRRQKTMHGHMGMMGQQMMMMGMGGRGMMKPK